MSTLLVLKYASWAISALIPFVGAWLFKFTEDVPGTDRRRLTRSGRTAFTFASGGLLLALGLTVATDVQARDDAAARRQAELKRAEAESTRDAVLEELKAETKKINQLVPLIAGKFEELTPSEQRTFVEVLGPEDFAARRPDLKGAILEGLMTGDFSASQAIFGEEMCKVARERFQQTPSCIALFGEEIPPVCWRSKAWQLADIRGYAKLMATSDASSIEVSYLGRTADDLDDPDWSKGLRLGFVNGHEQGSACSSSFSGSCKIVFNDKGQGTELFDLLTAVQLETIGVPMPDGLLSTTLSDAAAAEIHEAVNCLRP